MDLVSCFNPIRVHNKFTNVELMASCGKCSYCKNKRAAKWIARLEQERLYSLATFFCTLTYNNEHLPLLVPNVTVDSVDFQKGIFSDDTEFVSKDLGRDTISILFKDFNFDTKADLSYFHRHYLAFGGIPYACWRDIQLFHKRLNKYFHDKITNKYQNFRFFIVSEYGPTTFRPHFHALYFIQDERLLKSGVFRLGFDTCWRDCQGQPNGFTDCQLVQSTASSYVAQYLNSFSSLPSFYEHSQIRQNFRCSRRPSLGVCSFGEATDKEIFELSLAKVPFRRYSSDVSFVDVPLPTSLENKLFPKCSFFSSLSHSVRVELSQFACRYFGYDGKVNRGHRDFVGVLNRICSDLTENKYSFEISSYYHYMFVDVDIDLSTDVNNIMRLFYFSKRCIDLSVKYCCSLDYVIRRSEQYYANKELYLLGEFYRFQEDYVKRTNDSESLVHMYPIYADDNNVDAFYPLDTVPAFRCLKLNTDYKFEKSTKSHSKNAYFDTLKINNPLLFNLIFNYHAKKCNEVTQTLSSQGA